MEYTIKSFREGETIPAGSRFLFAEVIEEFIYPVGGAKSKSGQYIKFYYEVPVEEKNDTLMNNPDTFRVHDEQNDDATLNPTFS